MRKINSKKELEKRRRRNGIFLGIFMVGIMFLSVFGIVVSNFGSSDDSGIVKDSGEEFVPYQGYWLLEKEENVFLFTSLPSEVSEFVFGKRLEDFKNKVIYVSSEDSLSKTLIYGNLGAQENEIASRIQEACLEDEKCLNENLPTKNCDDNFIVIREAEKEAIYSENNCVFIEGSESELAGLVDSFFYNILEIK